MHNALPTAAALIAVLALAGPARSDQGYGAAYQQMWTQNPGTGAGTNRYLYDKYYRSNPNISPYVSGAVLGGNDYGNAYSTVVRPDLQNRARTASSQAQHIQQRKLQGNVGYTANPGVTMQNLNPGFVGPKPVPAARTNSGAYQNHWYGAWNQ